MNSDISEEKTQIKKIKRLKKTPKNNISPKFGQQRSYYKKKQQKNTTKFLNFGQQRSYIAHTQHRRTGHTGGI